MLFHFKKALEKLQLSLYIKREAQDFLRSLNNYLKSNYNTGFKISSIHFYVLSDVNKPPSARYQITVSLYFEKGNVFNDVYRSKIYGSYKAYKILNSMENN